MNSHPERGVDRPPATRYEIRVRIDDGCTDGVKSNKLGVNYIMFISADTVLFFLISAVRHIFLFSPSPMLFSVLPLRF